MQHHIAQEGYRRSKQNNVKVTKTQPLSKEIIGEPIPQNFMVPKITPFTRASDPESHLKSFQARMLISRGTDAIRCKMFVGTLTHIALEWFNTLPNALINSFLDFSRAFLERFSANRAKPMEMANMFDVRQNTDESLKQFLNRFSNISMKIVDPNKSLLVKAFVKGLWASSFRESLYWFPPKTLIEKRPKATVKIETKDAMK